MNNAKLFSDEAANIYERAISTLLKKNMLLYFAYADYEEVRRVSRLGTLCVCVCVCVRACMRACVCVSVCLPGWLAGCLSLSVSVCIALTLTALPKLGEYSYLLLTILLQD